MEIDSCVRLPIDVQGPLVMWWAVSTVAAAFAIAFLVKEMYYGGDDWRLTWRWVVLLCNPILLPGTISCAVLALVTSLLIWLWHRADSQG